MTAKAAKTRARGTTSPKRPRRSGKLPTTPLPISTTGVEGIDTEHEPGMPDSIDVAETARRLSPEEAKSSALSAGDLDASFAGLESGEKAVGGSDPLPDHNDVDRIGRALGVEEQDEKPLATTEKLEGRDRDRWELDPASAEDFSERERLWPPRRR